MYILCHIVKVLLGVHIRNVCLMHISMTFEPTRVDWLVGVAFGTIVHACAMKCEKCGKEGKAWQACPTLTPSSLTLSSGIPLTLSSGIPLEFSHNAGRLCSPSD